jgi:protocatechuate 3,4-dioxygenase beta subunit
VYDVDNGTCIPLKGAQLDIWHANAAGQYSDVQNTDTAGKKFLRGYQVTNDNGTARFTTIYPGWYEGRVVHIHMKVRTFDDSGNKTLEWTSQLFTDDSQSDQIYSQSPYSAHGTRDTRNNQDGIYMGASIDGAVQSNAGQPLMLKLSKQDNGYLGTFNIGLKPQRRAEQIRSSKLADWQRFLSSIRFNVRM